MHVVCSDNPVTKRKVLFFSPGVPGTWRADTSPNTPNHGPPTSSYIIQSLTLNKRNCMKTKTKDNLKVIFLSIGGIVFFCLGTLASLNGCEAVVVNIGQQIMK